ncbi:MAG: YidC/Oxa1 family membrane protein insertase [Streptosporangiaceae bacterium]
MTSLFGVPVDAAYYLVSGFTRFLTPALGGLAVVAAIIAVTIAVRLALMPLSLRAFRGQMAMARLAPQLQALRQRYGKQPERLQREMTALYKREGTSMFAGFGPLLLQAPVLSVVYLLFRSAQVGGKPNTLLGHDLLGAPLGGHWLSGAGALSAQGLVFAGLFVLLAGLCWLSARLARLMAVPPAAAAPGGAGQAAPALAGLGKLSRLLPYLTVVIAAFVPLAAGIYLLVSTTWALAERRLFWRITAAARAAQPQPEYQPERRQPQRRQPERRHPQRRQPVRR